MAGRLVLGLLYALYTNANLRAACNQLCGPTGDSEAARPGAAIARAVDALCNKCMDVTSEVSVIRLARVDGAASAAQYEPATVTL